jgi:hypothetical protein
MINQNIPDIGSTLTIIKPLGKPVSFRIGEIIEAKVLDIFSSGGIALKIKGSVLTAQAEMSLLKDSTVLFKVTGADKQGSELKLQFMGYSDTTVQPLTGGTGKDQMLTKLIDDLSGLLSKNLSSKNVSEAIEQLIKALPSDINTVSKELLVKLQDVLKAGMSRAGENIQTKLDKLMDMLPELLSPGDPLIRSMKNLREDVMIRIDNVLHASLKNALADTGISLEAKLKALVELLQKIDQPLTLADVSQIKTDLKAQLLQLKEQFFTTNKGGEAELVNSLLKDIETFQLLSKATDSFFTFLPVIWDELRKGEISFRKNRIDSRVRSFSCRLNLDLESFGELSIIVLMVDRAFSVYMKAEKNDFREILNASLDELHDRFSGSGLLLNNASVIDKELSPEELERLGSFERIVNIKI